MNKIRQFWALLKFQVASKPEIILLPLVFGALYFIPFITASGRHGSNTLEYLLSSQNMWLVGFLGVMLLVPEVMTSAATKGLWATGMEFLLTRAVDRPLVFRARSALFYFIILAIPMTAFLGALKKTDLQIDEYNRTEYGQVLDHMAGSVPSAVNGEKSTTITIPNGKILVKSWCLWLFVCTAIGVQVFINLVYPLKYRRFILWGTYLAFIFFPVFLVVNYFRSSAIESLSMRETVFFTFIAHQPFFWLATIAALLLGQLWCERRFSRFEQ